MKKVLLPAFTAVLALVLIGCETEQETRPAARQPSLSITPSNRNILVGEVVTITTQSENTLGRQAEIQWEAPAGQLSTAQQGRVARVQFDRPGTFPVRATLMVDGRAIETREVLVNVKPIG